MLLLNGPTRMKTGDAMLTQGANAEGVVYDTWVKHDTLATSIDCSKDGRTRQEFADECDINFLLRHYEDTGAWKSFNRLEPVYMDIPENIHDLPTALRVLERATASFMQLNARQRAEFDNDPVKFVQYCDDPANLPKLREMGLAPPAPVEAPPIKVEVTNAPASSPESPKP